MPRPRRLLVVLLGAAAALMAYLAVYQVDDAFIVYRYARHLAEGAGFVFNLGERVEGVTCFLWTLLLAPAAALHLPLPVVAPVLTAASGLATLAVTARAHARLEGRVELATRDLLAPALLAASPAFAYWSVGALETVPFTLLVTLATVEELRAVRDRAQDGRRSAMWLGLASLVRPETPVIVAAFAVDRLLRANGGVRDRVGAVARWLVPFVAWFVPFLGLRRLYFGDWLPNTYYAKTGAPFFTRIVHGLTYAQDCAASLVPSFGASGGVVVFLGSALIVALVVYAARVPGLRPAALTVLSVGAASVLEGGDWMVLQRFWVPALPALALIAASALLRAGATRPRRALAGAVAVLFVAHGVFGAVRERNGGRGLAVNGEGYRRAHIRVADYLDEHAMPGDAVALMDVGLIGWRVPRLRVIDITGLTDREIAHAPGGFLDKRYPVEALLARAPRFLVLVPGFRADERIAADPAFARDYSLIFKVNHRERWSPPSDYWLHVFERNDSRTGSGGTR